MKRYNNLYVKLCSFENLYSAYLKARKSKRYKEYVLDFSWNVEKELIKLQGELINKTYKHGEYYEFTLYDAKKREIKAAPFRDRVVHHALCNIIEPIFDKGFIYDSYACRKEKGTHKAVKRLDKFIQSSEEKWGKGNVYCLKCDISKYFDSIDHDTLFSLIERKIKDCDILWLTREIIDSSFVYDFKSHKTGIPIGNLTSQLFANLYLNELDIFVKHVLKERYYLRYMDDFLVLGNEKKKLHKEEILLRDFLKENFGLELHSRKVSLFPISKGISFLGYLIFREYKLVKRNTVMRFLKNMRQKGNGEIVNSIRSWFSFASYANTFSLKKVLVRKIGIVC